MSTYLNNIGLKESIHKIIIETATILHGDEGIHPLKSKIIDEAINIIDGIPK
ncbi:hypothetical protein L3i20_v225850 [Paenibacillus sp. L3-i20]|nr:hypothetical protein L3i20_v225850 [Paenibacillus sp. L3-i20]